MAKTDLIHVRVDTILKKEAEKVYENIGMDLSSAIRLFLEQSVIKRNLPFIIESREKVTPEILQQIASMLGSIEEEAVSEEYCDGESQEITQ